MIRVYEGKKNELSSKELEEILKKGYGAKNPMQISGAFKFLNDEMPAYIVGELEKIYQDQSDEYKDIMINSITNSVERFNHEDYGYITRNEKYNNTISVWLGGGGSYCIGRYELQLDSVLSYSIVVYSLDKQIIIFLLDEENLDVILKEFNCKEIEQDIICKPYNSKI